MTASVSPLSPSPIAPISATEMVRLIKHLPAAPKMLPQLKRLLCDPNTDTRDIVDLLRLDSAITASVLRVANSAYYANSDRHATVESAVGRLGYDQIYELVAYAVAAQVFLRPNEVYGIESDDLWRSSLATAMAAEALAIDTGQDRNIAYTSGLLSNMGMVAINEWSLRHCRGLRLMAENPEGERFVLGFDQAQVGAALLSDWGFPTEIVESVRWQYQPDAAGENTAMTSLVVLAKWMRDWLLGITDPVPTALLEQHGLSKERIYLLVADVGKRMAMIDSMLTSEQPAPSLPRRRFASDV